MILSEFERNPIGPELASKINVAASPRKMRGSRRSARLSERRDPESGQRGFTLAEAAIAMLVTVVGLTAVAGTFAIAIKTNSTSQNLTTATAFAQDKLEQLETISFSQLADPVNMTANPANHGSKDALIVGSLDTDVMTADGTYYYDKIVLAGPGDVAPEGTITVVRPDGTAETRQPDGTISQTNPFPSGRATYTRRWAIMSSNEPDVVNRRLTVAVRVVRQNGNALKAPEMVDLYTVLTSD
ncbi:MAG TPA: hypothetical protein VJX67_04875 [Blastocatellia bacterium]|nr:hypothetical protein [Blastocatellia bacterium]